MKLYIDDDLSYWHKENYPVISMFVEGSDLEHEADRVRKENGYATLFNRADPRIQLDAWYDFHIQFNAETEEVTELYAELNGNFEKDECPDWNSYTYLSFDSADLMNQIKEQLKDRFDMDLKDLNPEEEEK